MIPFLLFASLAGTLADRYSKRTMIYFTRILEILIMILGVVAFYYQTAVGGYAVLFLLATHSALFSPAKYGILPEIVKKEKISHYNGILTATTYLAIILGTFFASFLTDVTHKNFVLSGLFCILIALLAGLSSIGIEKTVAQSADKKISARFISEILKTLKRAKKTRYLLPAIVFGAYFLFMGAYTQLNIIPFTLESLGLSPEDGGYLFLMTAIGIGLGSFLAGQLSGDEVELGFVPLAAFGVALCYLGLFLFSTNLIIVALFLFLIGLCGGFYIVPVDAFIQVASNPGDRGQNVAAANFLSFVGVIIASGLLALLGNGFGLRACEGFLVVSILTFILGASLILIFLDQIFRLVVAKAAHFFWDLKIEGKEKISFDTPALLVGQRLSWLDTLIIVAILPRHIRYIVPISRNIRGRRFAYRLLRLIPFDVSFFSPLKEQAYYAINKELDAGHMICLMLPVEHASESIGKWREKVEELLSQFSAPVVAMHIERKSDVAHENHLKGVKRLFCHPTCVRFSRLNHEG